LSPVVTVWALMSAAGLVWAGELSGAVRERGTGDPVPGAIVQSGDIFAQCDDEGRYTLSLPDGEVTVQALAPGFAAEDRALTLPTTAPVDFFLVAAPPGVEVIVEARRQLPHVSGQVLDRERIEKTPGTYGDPVRLLQSLPGVAVTPEYSPKAGDVAVRGALPGESRFFFDGVEIPYLFHFQQYASVFHTRLVDELAFYPSTFGAPYGNATGAVVWATSREPETTRLHGGVDLSAIMGGGYITTPLGPGALSASARRSFADLGENSSDQYTVWPVFWDYLARYDQDLGDPNRHLSVTAFGAGDQYGRYAGDAAILDPLEQEANPELTSDRAFHALSTRYALTNDAGRHDTALAVVQDTLNTSLDGQAALRQDRYAWLRHDSLLGLGDKVILATGVEAKASAITRRNESDRAVPEVQREAPLLGRGLVVDERLVGGVVGVWVEPRLTLGITRTQLGLRAQWDTGSRSLGLDPRLSVTVSPRDDLRFKLAVGRYTQAPMLDHLSPVTGDPTLPAGRSDQVAGGVETAIAGRWELGVEGWGKRLQDVIVEPIGQGPYAVDGVAWGVELTSRYRLKDQFFTALSVTVGRSLRDGWPSDYDQPFALSWVASYDLNEVWNVGVRYRYAMGLPYTPATGGLYVGDTDTYDPLLGDPNSARLADYQKIDVHAERAVTLRTWTLVIYGELWLVPPRNNEMYVIYSYDYSQQAAVAGPRLLPLGGVRADF